MIIFFEKILPEGIFSKIGLFFLLKRNLFYIDTKKKRKISIPFSSISSLFWSRFFSQTRVTIEIHPKNLLSLVGFSHSDFLNLEFLAKNLIRKKIFPVSFLSFYIQNLKTSREKKKEIVVKPKTQGFHKTLEILDQKKPQSLSPGDSFYSRCQTKFLFNLFSLSFDKIFFWETPVSLFMDPKNLWNRCLVLNDNMRRFWCRKNCFELVFKKKKIWFCHFKQSFLLFKSHFENFQAVSIKALFSFNHHLVTFHSFHLVFSKKINLKKMEVDFFSTIGKKDKLSEYFFKKNKKIFCRKIFTTKQWLILIILSHNKKRTPLTVKENYEIS